MSGSEEVGQLLAVKGLEVAYGDIQVLWGVDLTVEPSETVALVGSNGAGKTTLLRTISGQLPAKGGSIQFDGQELVGRSAADIVRLGIAHVPEGRQLFFGLSIRDNLLMGAYTRKDTAEIARDLEWIWSLFPELVDKQRRQTGTLSGGEQQMVAIGRALMSRPRLLLIDELSLGLAPVVVDRLTGLLADIRRDTQVAILFVEQDVHLALEMASRGYILDQGRVRQSGLSEELLNDPTVKQAYLGI